MIQRCEDLPLFTKARDRVRTALMQHLDRDVRSILGVVARGQVHGAHAALAERALDAIHAEPPADQRTGGTGREAFERDGDRGLQRRARSSRAREQARDLGAQLDVVAARACEIVVALSGRQLDRGLEQLLDPLPAVHDVGVCTWRWIHASASRRSRATVLTWTPSTSAISAWRRPPK